MSDKPQYYDELAELRRERDELRNAVIAILERHGPISIREHDEAGTYLSPAAIMIDGALLKALFDAAASTEKETQ